MQLNTTAGAAAIDTARAPHWAWLVIQSPVLAILPASALAAARTEN
jgi:hypothetical protein